MNAIISTLGVLLASGLIVVMAHVIWCLLSKASPRTTLIIIMSVLVLSLVLMFKFS